MDEPTSPVFHPPPTIMLSPDQYRLEKNRIAVALRLLSGERVRGFIFVQPSNYYHVGHEEAIDLFNAPEPFFPIETDKGDVLLLAKDRVIEVEGVVPSEQDDLRRASARQVELTVTLADGVVRTGGVLLEMPSDRPRLLDFLNQISQRFFALYVDEDVYLINRSAIDQVRPRD
ncbi:MAG: hypothetical protein M3373_10110 [Gemmatimonadota bacterium]|nr:hypothetical protein [Gemmatimonadota bacterium]